MSKIIYKDLSKYITLQSLLTEQNKLNASITKLLRFKDTQIYKDVIEQSKELDIFGNVEWKDRFNYLYNKMHLSYCPVCGKPYVYFSTSQTRYRLCNHKIHYNKDLFLKSKQENKIKRKEQFDKNLSDSTLYLEAETFEKIANELYHKDNNFTFTLSKKYIKFYHDLIIKTKDYLPIDLSDYRFSERIYCYVNKITKQPVCEACGKPVEFYNRIHGYHRTCKNTLCTNNLVRTQSGSIYKDIIDSQIDSSKYEVIEYPNYLVKDYLVVRCKKCNTITKNKLLNGVITCLANVQLCQKCKGDHSSRCQYEVYEFLSKYISHIKYNVRSIIFPYELDIYVPEKKIAIEYNGVYWHRAESPEDKKRHLNKTNLCEKLGIHLIHIFENEWKTKQEIIKSRIKNLLGIYDNVIYARNCEIKQLSSKDSNKFIDENHLQGHTNCAINLGLFHNDELVSVMTFSKTRFSKQYEYELVRFCSKLNYHIPGAASKLLKYFERNYKPKSLISYADRRWTSTFNSVYQKLGFTFSHASSPNYWYFLQSSTCLESRVKYQKHKLKNLLEKFDPNKTEYENMQDNGYFRIFDCGNLVFVKNY